MGSGILLYNVNATSQENIVSVVRVKDVQVEYTAMQTQARTGMKESGPIKGRICKTERYAKAEHATG
jgi:hypothetical protein